MVKKSNMDQIIFTPADFVAVFNQTLEMVYPEVIIEGELTNFRVSRGTWVYFDIKDESASVKFFGTVYSLPGPLEEGMVLRVVGSPRLHPLYGFSVNVHVACDDRISLYPAAPFRLATLLHAWTIARVGWGSLPIPTGEVQSTWQSISSKSHP